MHNSSCPLGPAIEVHLCPYDIDRMGWDEGEDIAGLMLVSNDSVQPDRMRILCAGDIEREPTPGSQAKALPQPTKIDVPHYPGAIIDPPPKKLVHASSLWTDGWGYDSWT